MKRLSTYQVITYFVLIIMSALAVFPFLLMLSSSLCSEQSLLTYGYKLFPREISFGAYDYLRNNSSTILRAYGITLFVTFFGTVVGTTVTMLLAYPLSIRDLPGRKVVNFLVYFTMLFNGGLVPT